MRTIIAHYLNDDEVAVRTIIAHCLNDDETWADYGLDQPNPVFTHEADWPFCPLCGEGEAG